MTHLQPQGLNSYIVHNISTDKANKAPQMKTIKAYEIKAVTNWHTANNGADKLVKLQAVRHYKLVLLDIQFILSSVSGQSQLFLLNVRL